MPCFKQYLLIFLMLPVCAFAQDTGTLKKQADRFAKASFNGDYKTVIDLTYPQMVAYSGGRDTLQKLITDRIAALRTQGVMTFDGSIGSPGPFLKAGSQIHCLVPETLILKIFNGRYVTSTYLLAISNDNGSNWTFMDVGKMPPDILLKIVPNYNTDLRIPLAGKPLFFAD